MHAQCMEDSAVSPDACIGESAMASRTSDRSAIAASISTLPDAFLKTVVPVFSTNLSHHYHHHSSRSELVAITIKVPVIIHSWPDELRKAQLVTGSYSHTAKNILI